MADYADIRTISIFQAALPELNVEDLEDELDEIRTEIAAGSFGKADTSDREREIAFLKLLDAIEAKLEDGKFEDALEVLSASEQIIAEE